MKVKSNSNGTIEMQKEPESNKTIIVKLISNENHIKSDDYIIVSGVLKRNLLGVGNKITLNDAIVEEFGEKAKEKLLSDKQVIKEADYKNYIENIEPILSKTNEAYDESYNKGIKRSLELLPQNLSFNSRMEIYSHLIQVKENYETLTKAYTNYQFSGHFTNLSDKNEELMLENLKFMALSSQDRAKAAEELASIANMGILARPENLHNFQELVSRSDEYLINAVLNENEFHSNIGYSAK